MRNSRQGKREDLGGLFLRSSWEANACRVLNLLIERGEISAWTYEPQRFYYPLKRAKSYLPDFEVFREDGTHFWLEIKGYMDKVSATKMRRFEKYFPDEEMVLIGAAEYKDFRKEFKDLVDNWE